MKPWLFLGRENHEILDEINESNDRELSLKGFHDMCMVFVFHHWFLSKTHVVVVSIESTSLLVRTSPNSILSTKS